MGRWLGGWAGQSQSASRRGAGALKGGLICWHAAQPNPCTCGTLSCLQARQAPPQKAQGRHQQMRAQVGNRV